MPKVAYTMENADKCRCPSCPVQTKSECTKELMMKAMEAKNRGELPEPEIMPGLYCRIGRAKCKDLDPSAPCQCPTCLVWQENDLFSQYFCLKGNADEIEK
jgi:hypothetical protein